MRPEQGHSALQFADRAIQVAKSTSGADGKELTAIAGHFVRLQGKNRKTAFRRVRTHEGKPKNRAAAIRLGTEIAYQEKKQHEKRNNFQP